jgi:hypothetical protein
MIMFPRIGLALIAAASLASCNAAPDAFSAPAKAAATTAKLSAATPIVVELYQSQGCSSCPPANAALNKIAARSDVIALSFAVDYWDGLGWKDRFATPAFTKRQRDYAKSLGNGNVFTPQMVLNGAQDIVGNGPGELDRAIARTNPLSASPGISGTDGAVTIGRGSTSGEIWLIRYDPALLNVDITAGENKARRLPHRNVVREMHLLGQYNGAAQSYALPKPKLSGLTNVVILQRKGVGKIIAARRI